MPTYGSTTYGANTYAGPLIGQEVPGVVPPLLPAPAQFPAGSDLRLQRNLPRLYADGSVMRLLAEAISEEFDLVYAALAEIQSQAFVLSSTWGIQYWESLLALPSNPEVALSSRRAAVLAQLAPAGPVNVLSIENYVSQFNHGTVDVTYIPQLWQVTIQFSDFRGRPPDIDVMQAGLDALVPAWLGLNYDFRYTTYGELKNWGVTYGELKALGLTYGQLKTWRPSGAGASQASDSAATFAQPTATLAAQTTSTAATFAQPSQTIVPGGT